MVTQMSKRVRALVWCLVGLGLAGVAQAQHRFLTVGTGAVTGVYYAAGGAVCRMVNKDRRDHGLRCTVESTGGSVANIQALLSGDLDFGVIQSDALYAATKGVRAFEGKPQTSLRAVFSLHPEPLTLVVRKESNIRTLADLRGKRVNVGNPGSGTRVSVDELLSVTGIKLGDLGVVSELNADEHGAALCANRIDAFFYVVGHPSANVQDPMTACGARLVSITGAGVDRLLGANPYYSQATIPARTYPSQDQRFDTYGMLATMVTTAARSDEEVYVLTRSVFENLDEFRKLHPAFAFLSSDKMRQAGLVAPLHPGAARYFREKGWIGGTRP
jgi:TRAP transporter TAXI family solute receptor